MANIIYDEKRAVRIGEVCAVSLKNICPIYLTLVDSKMDGVYDDINFYVKEENGISSDDEITFVKYIGNGMFMDLVSDQLLISEVFNADDFGTDEFHAMDKVSQDELEKMEDFWNSVQNPKTKLEFSDSFSVFMQNPLAIKIDISTAPFMSINSEITKKFASQSLEQLKTKMMSAKAMAQQGLKEQYSQYERQIVEIISTVERESAPKTM